jgi:hypothetical protein
MNRPESLFAAARQQRKQGEAARGRKMLKANPETEIAPMGKDDRQPDEQRQRHQHHVAHVARPCGADEDAVHLKREDARERRQRRPEQIVPGFQPNRLERGHQSHDLVSENQEERGGEPGQRQIPKRSSASLP